jgi:hypothetical protein
MLMQLRAIAGVLATIVGWRLLQTPRRRAPSQPSASSDNAVIQFCAVEYEAMMAKVHLWLTLQFTLASLVIVTLTLLAQLWQLIPVFGLIWLAVLVTVIAYNSYLNVKLEGLRAVLYVEEEIRRRATNLQQSDDVFGWERFFSDGGARTLPSP